MPSVRLQARHPSHFRPAVVSCWRRLLALVFASESVPSRRQHDELLDGPELHAPIAELNEECAFAGLFWQSRDVDCYARSRRDYPVEWQSRRTGVEVAIE